MPVDMSRHAGATGTGNEFLIHSLYHSFKKVPHDYRFLCYDFILILGQCTLCRSLKVQQQKYGLLIRLHGNLVPLKCKQFLKSYAFQIKYRD